MRRVWPNGLRDKDEDHVHAGATYATGSNARGSRRATVYTNSIIYTHTSEESSPNAQTSLRE